MSPRADTWMPMYWGDYARDTGHLNAAGHGAYLMLIKHYWCTGVPLTDDDDELWRIACCDSKKDWLKLRPKIVRMFDVLGGSLHHKRIDKEIGKARSLSDAKVEAGKKGAEKRWQEDRSAIGKSEAEPSPASRKQDGTEMADPLAEPSNSQWQNDAHARASSQPQLHIPSSLRSEGGSEADTERESLSEEPKPPDPKAEFWAVGKRALPGLGLKAKEISGFLGTMAKESGHRYAEMAELLRRAEADPPGEAQSWLMAGARALKRNGVAATSPPDPADPWGANAWARAYPGVQWAKLQGQPEPCVNDICVAVVAREVCELCGLDPKFRPKLDAVAEWAADGIDACEDAPMRAIEAQIERMAGDPIHSLKVFDFAVRGSVRRARA